MRRYIPMIQGRTNRRGFTLVELMLAMVISLLIMSVVLAVVSQTSKIWMLSTAKIAAFQDARTAFDLITRNLSQSTLNTYLGYDNAAKPTTYMRMSELRYYSGNAGIAGVPGVPGTGQAVCFMAPLSYTSNVTAYGPAESLLNVCGYYISFTTDPNVPAHVPASANPYRYRLMQLLVPTETQNAVYGATGNAWFTAAGITGYATPIADNVIALIIQPIDPSAAANAQDLTAGTFTYDTTTGTATIPQPSNANQLPPDVMVTMVAIDEKSAKLLDSGSSQPNRISTALAGKFTSSSPAAIASDLANLENSLTGTTPRIQYRVFSTTVAIQESKWTK